MSEKHIENIRYRAELELADFLVENNMISSEIYESDYAKVEGMTLLEVSGDPYYFGDIHYITFRNVWRNLNDYRSIVDIYDTLYPDRRDRKTASKRQQIRRALEHFLGEGTATGVPEAADELRAHTLNDRDAMVQQFMKNKVKNRQGKEFNPGDPMDSIDPGKKRGRSRTGNLEAAQEIFTGELYSDVSRIPPRRWAQWWKKLISSKSNVPDQFGNWTRHFVMGYQIERGLLYEIWYNSYDSTFSVFDHFGNATRNAERVSRLRDAIDVMFVHVARSSQHDAEVYQKTGPNLSRMIRDIEKEAIAAMGENKQREAEMKKRKKKVSSTPDEETFTADDINLGQNAPRGRSGFSGAGAGAGVGSAPSEKDRAEANKGSAERNSTLEAMLKAREERKRQKRAEREHKKAFEDEVEDFDSEYEFRNRKEQEAYRKSNAAIPSKTKRQVEKDEERRNRQNVTIDNETGEVIPMGSDESKSKKYAKEKDEFLRTLQVERERKRLETEKKERDSKFTSNSMPANTRKSDEDDPEAKAKRVAAEIRKRGGAADLDKARKDTNSSSYVYRNDGTPFKTLGSAKSAAASKNRVRKDGNKFEPVENPDGDGYVLKLKVQTDQDKYEKRKKRSGERIIDLPDPDDMDYDDFSDISDMFESANELEAFTSGDPENVNTNPLYGKRSNDAVEQVRKQAETSQYTKAMLRNAVIDGFIKPYDKTRARQKSSAMGWLSNLMRLTRGRPTPVEVPRDKVGMSKRVKGFFSGVEARADFIIGFTVNNVANYEIWYVQEVSWSMKKRYASFYIYDVTAEMVIESNIPFYRNALHILNLKIGAAVPEEEK